MTVSAVRPWRTALQRERSLPSGRRWPGAFERVAAVGFDLFERYSLRNDQDKLASFCQEQPKPFGMNGTWSTSGV